MADLEDKFGGGITKNYKAWVNASCGDSVSYNGTWKETTKNSCVTYSVSNNVISITTSSNSSTSTDAVALFTWTSSKLSSCSKTLQITVPKKAVTTTPSNNCVIAIKATNSIAFWNINLTVRLKPKSSSLSTIEIGTVNVSSGCYDTNSFTVDLSSLVGEEVYIDYSCGACNCYKTVSTGAGTLSFESANSSTQNITSGTGSTNTFTLQANTFNSVWKATSSDCPYSTSSVIGKCSSSSGSSSSSSSSSSVSIVTSSNSTTAYVQNSTSSCYTVKVIFYYNKPSDDPNGGSSGTVYTLYENLTVAANSSSTPFGDTSKMTYNIASKTTC
jgi:hypothetical protein